MLGAVPTRQIDPADEERGRQRIRTCGVRGYDACAEDAIRRPAGPRIDDVTVAMPVGDDELLAGAARPERGVPQPDAAMAARPETARQRRPANRHRDRPVRAGCCRRPKAAHAARPTRAARALPDRARSPCRSRRGSARSLDGRSGPTASEPTCTASNPTCRRAPQSHRVGHAPLAPQETPATAERHRRDVKGTPGIPIQALAVRQQIDHVCRDRNSPVGGTAIQGGDRAGLAEDAQLVFQAIDLVERPCRRRDEHASAAGRYLEPAGHRAAMHADPMAGRHFAPGVLASRRERGEELTAIRKGWLVEPMAGFR